MTPCKLENSQLLICICFHHNCKIQFIRCAYRWYFGMFIMLIASRDVACCNYRGKIQLIVLCLIINNQNILKCMACIHHFLIDHKRILVGDV